MHIFYILTFQSVCWRILANLCFIGGRATSWEVGCRYAIYPNLHIAQYYKVANFRSVDIQFQKSPSNFCVSCCHIFLSETFRIKQNSYVHRKQHLRLIVFLFLSLSPAFKKILKQMIYPCKALI